MISGDLCLYRGLSTCSSALLDKGWGEPSASVALPSAADSVILLLFNSHRARTHGQLGRQLFDKQGGAFHMLIGFVVEI